MLPSTVGSVGAFKPTCECFLPVDYQLLLRVPNPLANGPPLRFANQTQDRHLPGWLTLGEFMR